MTFKFDERLELSSFKLIDWPLSSVLLKNNNDYPWFILVPRVAGLTEISQCLKADRYQLMDEIHELSLIVQDIFKPNKLNIGSLGNIVKQLHIHVVARFQTDPLWPQGIWQSSTKDNPYDDPQSLIQDLKDQLSSINF